MVFDYRRAVKLRQERRRQVCRWKDIYGWSRNEIRNDIRHFDTGDALADALDEMSKEEITLLVRRLVNALK